MSATGPGNCALLRDALIHVETLSSHLAGVMRDVEDQIKRNPPPKEFRYIEPPDRTRSTEELVVRKERQRSEAPTEWAHWYQLFDRYHRDQREWRSALISAIDAVSAASSELDLDTVEPLHRTTIDIKLDLRKLGGSCPSPITHGPWPPLDQEIPSRLLEYVRPVSEWVDRLLAYVRDGGSERPEHEDIRAIKARDLKPLALQRVLAVYGRLSGTDADSILRSELTALGLSKTTVDAAANRAAQRGDASCKQRRGKLVEFSREFLLRYVVTSYVPKG